MVDAVAPAGTHDRGLRVAGHRDGDRRRAGAAAGGALAEDAGPVATFVLAGGAGAVALLAIALLRAATVGRAGAAGAPAVAAA